MINPKIILKVQKKDMNSFRKLYDFYREKVYYTALTVVRDRSLAEDVLQETFMKVYKSIDSLAKPECFETWIYKITLNTARTMIRNKNKLVYLDDTDENYTELPDEDKYAIPEIRFMFRQNITALMNSIHQLPEQQSVPLMLFYFHNLSLEQIAEIMECPLGTVKSRMYHGKQTLRDKLNRNEVEVRVL